MVGKLGLGKMGVEPHFTQRSIDVAVEAPRCAPVVLQMRLSFLLASEATSSLFEQANGRPDHLPDKDLIALSFPAASSSDGLASSTRMVDGRSSPSSPSLSIINLNH